VTRFFLPVSALDSRSLSCLRRSTVLKFSNLDKASLQGLEEIPALELLDLRGGINLTHVDDVRSVAGCRGLKELLLTRSSVTDTGIIGLERIATLEVLNLAGCCHITSVTSLRHCTALRELSLDGTRVTDAGIAGLECIGTLTKLSLAFCTLITSVSPAALPFATRAGHLQHGVEGSGFDGPRRDRYVAMSQSRRAHST
jgi:hypothetical protein